MKVLVACEFSGIVREAFNKVGNDAWSCDILDSEIPGNHLKGDIREYINGDWDLLIAHPPCTYLTVSGNKWFKPEYKERFPFRLKNRWDAIDFFIFLMFQDIHKICIENPIGIISTVYRKPDQILQPYMFGHPETKATCLWLKNLPVLYPTNIVEIPGDKKLSMRLHYLPPSKDRWKERSRTFTGIAEAMALQWGTTKYDVIATNRNG